MIPIYSLSNIILSELTNFSSLLIRSPARASFLGADKPNNELSMFMCHWYKHHLNNLKHTTQQTRELYTHSSNPRWMIIEPDFSKGIQNAYWKQALGWALQIELYSFRFHRNSYGLANGDLLIDGFHVHIYISLRLRLYQILFGELVTSTNCSCNPEYRIAIHQIVVCVFLLEFYYHWFFSPQVSSTHTLTILACWLVFIFFHFFPITFSFP